jgi:hypothetical protein
MYHSLTLTLTLTLTLIDRSVGNRNKQALMMRAIDVCLQSLDTGCSDMGFACPTGDTNCSSFAGATFGPTSGWNALVIAAPFALLSTMMGFVAHDVRARYIRA